MLPGGALTNGAVVNTTTSGGSTPYSVGTVVLDHAVTAVNDAPTVTGGSVVSLTTIGEDSAPGVGQTVSSLFSSHFSDAKDQVSGGSSADTFTGVAVTSNTATAGQGVYQYFSGGSWHDLPAVSTASAFVLDSSTLVRFVAAADYSGSPPSLIVHIIEDSSGAVTTGATANLSTTGGSTEYGTAMTLGITVTPTNDIHTGGASVSGTATEDQVLTAVSTMADPDGIGTLHYQWQHDVGSGFVNVGADQSTYTLGDGDIGGVVRVVIYYTDAGGTVESATSAATSSITAFNDAPTGGASITGTATEDQVLTANTTTLADTDGLGTLHYDWQRDTGSGFVSIGAADQATYTLGDADVGGVVRVVVSYTDGQGFANNVTSAGTAAIAGVNDPHTGGVSVSGTATENQVLTANTTTLAEADGVGTLHYQWQRDTGSGFVNVGTDQSTYTLGDADVGGVVRVVVNYTDDQGFAESATSAASAAIANVNDAPTGGVSITGHDD
ncbi:hypothetical protein LP421_30095 (plasmid) [Rhizobium sp. RCAM05350]|nr:hypothetical protein LP421_30095 [Rhizobium sp. RCAM05350]